MCRLCGGTPEERAKAAEYERARATELRRMAAHIERLANGHVEPHGEEAARYAEKARSIIRYLVMEWM